jgi:hypothetical protein
MALIVGGICGTDPVVETGNTGVMAGGGCGKVDPVPLVMLGGMGPDCEDGGDEVGEIRYVGVLGSLISPKEGGLVILNPGLE